MLWFREGYPRPNPPDVEDIEADAWVETGNGGNRSGNGTGSVNGTGSGSDNGNLS